MKATRELVIDSFAGGGGASIGIVQALGRAPDVAINHDTAAIAMHAANHPETRHYTEDVWKVSPRQVTRGRPVGLLWASPDCKHFSRAKGGKPVEKTIRSLAWVVCRWAAECPPRVIILENVREFEDWGPLVPRWDCSACGWKGTEGQATLARRRRKCPRCESGRLVRTEFQLPDPTRKGLTFKRFVGRLRNLGYDVAWKVLNAADFGAPTHRRRLFLIARNDGEPIIWPDATHGDPKKLAESGSGLFPVALEPWRTASECIDWSIPCPSIFTRKRPLAEKTLRRIAMGIKRYVLDNPRPFIVDMQRANRPRGVDEPLGTVTTQGNRFNVVTPVVVPVTHAGERRSYSPDEPLPTVTGANRGELAVTEAVFAHVCETEGGDIIKSSTSGRRCKVCGKHPAKTVSAPLLARISQTGGNGKYSNGVDEPLTSVVSKAEHLLVSPYLVPRYGEAIGQVPRSGSVEAPLGVVTPTANGGSLVAAFLAKHFGGVVGVPADTPLPTTTTRGTQTQLVAANLVHLNNNTRPTPVDDPLHTITSGGNHAALVYSFLMKYFGSGGQWSSPADPLHTATARARFGLVTVTIAGEPYVLVDIGMRMLKPRELARGQGFPDSYHLTGTATSQVEKIGNSVPPVMARILVAANYAASLAGAVA